MKEKIKTVSLIILVILGIYLTQKVWFKFPEILSSLFREDEIPGEINLLHDIIIPEKYELNFGDGDYTIIYDDTDYGLWKETKKSIKYIFSSKDIIVSKITEEEYKDLKENKFIEFIFSQPMNSHILTSSLDIMDLNHIVDEIGEIHKIFVSLNDEFFIFTSGNNHILIDDGKLMITTLKTQVNSMRIQGNYINYEPMESISSDIYIPAATDIYLHELNVSNNLLSLDDLGRNQLAEKFFSREIDYIREIVESNGSTIYEYDNNVLKLNSDGVIEYFHTLEDNYPDPNLYVSLSTAVDFLINRVGISNGIFLSKVEEIQADNSNGYRVYFRHKTNTIPLLVGEGFGDYIEVDVFNNQIKTYRQLANEGQVINEIMINIISPKEIIDNYIEYFEEDSIESIDLSYFDPVTRLSNQRLLLVWVIETTDNLYAFDAYSGSLVYKR